MQKTKAQMWYVVRASNPIRMLLTQTALGEEKPHCLRCRRAGLECGGYERSFKWVDEGENP